jgi:hypothetical protein
MNQHANPLDYILRCAEIGIVPYQFDINNAKDELNKLREELNSLKNMSPVVWVRINSSGDFYDPRLNNNPYIDQNTVVPLYQIKT